MRVRVGFEVLSVMLACLCATQVRAQSQAGLPVALSRPNQIRVDGDLGEWRSLHFEALGDASDGSAELCLAHDAQGLYVAARVHDDTLIRSAQPSPREDALVLTLALPAGGGSYRAQELWLYAGVIGRSKAVVALAEPGGGAQRALPTPARIVEGPFAGGYVIEAFVPWSALDHGASWPFARAALRLHDVDHRGAAAHEVSTAGAPAAARLPWLRFDGGPIEALSGFLQTKNLGATVPKLDWVGDVRGDGQVEHVMVISTYVVLGDAGPRFAFDDLPVTSGADVREAVMTDLTNDGRPELVATLRQRNQLGERDIFQVFDLRGERARAIFGVETRKQTRDGFVEAALEVRKGKAGREIVTRAGSAQGLSAENYQESPAIGVEAILLPWGRVAERVYAWDEKSQRFVVLREEQNPQAAAAPEPAVAKVAATPLPAPLPAAAPSVSALIATFKQARGLAPATAPRLSERANVAEDARPESLQLFGTELLVVGEGFRGGASFFYFGLPVRDPADVLQLFTGDVTGDGRSEIFVRVRTQVGVVQREILLGYTFVQSALAPIIAVEVRRASGVANISNVVSLLRGAGRRVLQIEPGVAEGWSAQSYPFVSESVDSTAPLLLPWKDRRVRYGYDGQRLVPQAGRD